MRTARTYASWKSAAEEFEEDTGLREWRRDPNSDHYHEGLIRQQLSELRRLREAGEIPKLVDHRHESMHRNLGDVGSPEIYTVSPLGTKDLIEEYLAEIEATVEALVQADIPGWPAAEKRNVVEQALANFGRSALLLSGGATLGFYHLGVVKALWAAGLLPEVISGASMGAMIASGVCCRTDDELDTLFEGEVYDLARRGLGLRGPFGMLRERSLLRPEVLLETIENNCGVYTFEDAFERSGRVLNISVSPTRTRQKPRILCHQTAPKVLIPSAALASSAVPGLFPPVVLEQQARDGAVRPYIPTERWIDGSFGGDLPMMRMSRLHNVNHFIVSQANPHVVPFLHSSTKKGVGGFAMGLAVGAMRSQGVQAVSIAKLAMAATPLKGSLDLLLSLAQQEYRGDIDIHPRFEPLQYRKLLRNPTRDDLAHFVLEGERATWPKLAMIRDQTRIARCLSAALKALS
jgi:TAG lipase / steryl ester hydrolase / phospholipase A2 / LPA acyltransferase